MGGQVVANSRGDGPWGNLALCTSVWTFTRTASTSQWPTRRETPRFDTLGSVAGGATAVSKSMRRLVSAGHRLHIVYEAGPCGFVLQRHFTALGWRCDVVAPSSVPHPSGERIKTDRRDAMKLARLARSNDLAVVRVPDGADEAIRDLVRARDDAVREQRNGRHRLKALLLRSAPACALAHAGDLRP